MMAENEFGRRLASARKSQQRTLGRKAINSKRRRARFSRILHEVPYERTAAKERPRPEGWPASASGGL